MPGPESPAATPPGPPTDPDVRAFVREHKRGVAMIAAVIVFVIAITALTVAAGSNPAPLTDASTCSQYSTAGAAQKNAYAQLYLREYGGSPSTEQYASQVQAALTQDCIHAAYLGEEDDVSVLAALRHAF